MASVFPGALDNFATNLANNTATPNTHPAHHNDLADAVNKIEIALGAGLASLRAPYLIGDADDVLWLSDIGDFTEVDPTGTTTWTERAGLASAKFAGQSNADLGALLKAHTFVVGDEFATRLRFLGEDTNHTMVGLAFTDGVIATSNVVAGIAYNGDGTAKVSDWHGTLTNLATAVAVHDGLQTLQWSDGVYVKLIYSAANSFEIQWSPDGVSWSNFGTAAFAKTMTPTHFGPVVSRFGGAGDGLGSFGPLAKLN